MDSLAYCIRDSSKDGDNQTSDIDLEVQVNKKLKEISKSRLTNNPCLNDYVDFIDVISEDTRSADADHSYLQPLENSPSSGSECSGISRSSLETSSVSSTELQSGNRTNYTPEQVQKLTEAFDKNKYPDAEEREKIAATVGVSEKKVKIWFQNKRARSKPRNNTQLRIPPCVIPSLYVPQASMFQSLPPPYGPAPTIPMPTTTSSSFLPYSGLPQLTSVASPRFPVEAFGNFLSQQPQISSYQPSLPYQRPEPMSPYVYPYIYPAY